MKDLLYIYIGFNIDRLSFFLKAADGMTKQSIHIH